MLKGIDISVWQGKIDWSEVAKDENVKFAILRAGYGMYASQKDDRFEEYYAGCKRYNIPVGAYWFSYATTKEEAIQEAKACIECIKGKQFEYPILFDIEHSSQTSKAVADVIIPAFCDTLKAAGYYVGIYTYYNFIKSYISESVYSKYDLALAHYASSTPWSDKEIWQYSSKGRIQGINDRVDLDYCYVENYPEKIKSLGLNNLGKSSTTVTEETKPATPKKYMVSIDKPAPANKITTFSANDKTQISEHFNVQEFKCKCGKEHDILINLYLVYMLEKIMDTMKCSMTIINSGYRCPDYDKKIGGFVGQHGIGNAVDAVFYDQKKKVIDTRLISCVAQDLGLGGIANITKTYTSIHLDARTSNIWKGNEVVSNSTVTNDFYKYYGLTKDDVYKNMKVPVKPTTPTTPTKPSSSTTIKAGQKVTLKNATLYASATAKSGSSKSGTYYVYDTEVISNRIRVTNSASNVGKTPVGSYVSGWVDKSVVTGTTSTPSSSSSSSSTSIKAGQKVTLKNATLYASATAKSGSSKSGTYYVYDAEVVSNRVRITNSASNVGKTPVGSYVSGWVDKSVITGTTSTSTSTTSLKAGTKVTLKSVELYASATDTKSSGKKSGTYYIYSNETSNGRIRITNSASNVGKTPVGSYVSGWVKTSDIK